MNLPVPSTRSGYLVAIILTLGWLLFYYAGGISYHFYKIYTDYMYTRSLNLLKTSTCQNLPVTITARIPKNSSELIPGYIYLRVINGQEKTIRNLSISISGTGRGKDTSDILPLPAVYKLNIFPNTALLENVPPEGVMFLRLPLIFTSIEKFTLYISIGDQNYICGIDAQPENLRGSQSEALKRAVVENLLLPPWSNVVVPTFVFVLVYLLEDDEKDKTGAKKTFCLFGWTLLESILFYKTMDAWLAGSRYVWLWGILFVLLGLGLKAKKGITKGHPPSSQTSEG